MPLTAHAAVSEQPPQGILGGYQFTHTLSAAAVAAEVRDA